MIVAIMQPYFFPYIGYFQLMKAADIFVFLDDVQYIQRGWVNRNRIRSQQRWVWLTRAVEKAPREWNIAQRLYTERGPNCAEDVYQRVMSLYQGAPFYEATSTLIGSLIKHAERNVAKFNRHHIEVIARVLGITTPCMNSSEIFPCGHLRGQERIIALCRKLGASTYINPIGGVSLYDSETFHQSGVDLRFLRTTELPVNLHPEPTHLSIIDHIMGNGIHATSNIIRNYELCSTRYQQASQNK